MHYHLHIGLTAVLNLHASTEVYYGCRILRMHTKASAIAKSLLNGVLTLREHLTEAYAWHRNYEDAYTDPGSPATRRTEIGTYVLAMLDGQKKLLMQGSHACNFLAFMSNINFFNAVNHCRQVWLCSHVYIV